MDLFYHAVTPVGPYCPTRRRPGFTKATAIAWRVSLEARVGLTPKEALGDQANPATARWNVSWKMLQPDGGVLFNEQSPGTMSLALDMVLRLDAT
jgi:hypothetical protein